MFFNVSVKKKVEKVSNFGKFPGQSCRLKNDVTFHEKLIQLDEYLLNKQLFKKALGRETITASYANPFLCYESVSL